MNTIVLSWLNCLKMLSPSNLVPLIQVTLKTLLEVYKTVFKRLWVIPLIVAVTFFFIVFLVSAFNSFKFYMFFIYYIVALPYFLVGLWGWALLLASRPSVELKDFSYFKKYVLYLIPLFLLVVLLAWPPIYLNVQPGGKIFSWAMICVISPFIAFMFFFLFDANSTTSEMIRAPWRAFKMSLALLPLYALLSLLLYGVGKLLWSFSIAYSSKLLGLVLGSFSLLLILPVFIVFISRLYVITIHKNYKEYYERCW